jgi:hypothetical protein
MYGLFYECKFLTIEETNKKKVKKKKSNKNLVGDREKKIHLTWMYKDLQHNYYVTIAFF